MPPGGNESCKHVKAELENMGEGYKRTCRKDTVILRETKKGT